MVSLKDVQISTISPMLITGGVLSLIGSFSILLTGYMFPSLVEGKIYMKILLTISFCDFVGSLFMSTGFAPTESYCSVQAGIVIFFYRAQWMWTCIISSQLHSLIRYERLTLDFQGMNVLVWTINILLEILPLLLPYGPSPHDGEENIGYGTDDGAIGHTICTFRSTSSDDVHLTDIVASLVVFFPLLLLMTIMVWYWLRTKWMYRTLLQQHEQFSIISSNPSSSKGQENINQPTPIHLQNGGGVILRRDTGGSTSSGGDIGANSDSDMNRNRNRDKVDEQSNSNSELSELSLGLDQIDAHSLAMGLANERHISFSGGSNSNYSRRGSGTSGNGSNSGNISNSRSVFRAAQSEEDFTDSDDMDSEGETDSDEESYADEEGGSGDRLFVQRTERGSYAEQFRTMGSRRRREALERMSQMTNALFIYPAVLFVCWIPLAVLFTTVGGFHRHSDAVKTGTEDASTRRSQLMLWENVTIAWGALHGFFLSLMFFAYSPHARMHWAHYWREQLRPGIDRLLPCCHDINIGINLGKIRYSVLGTGSGGRDDEGIERLYSNNSYHSDGISIGETGSDLDSHLMS